MAFDTFIKIGDVKSESGDAGHLEWIEVFEYSHSMVQNNVGEVSTSGGRSVGRVDFEKFSFVKDVDASSPLLYLHLCKGKHFPTTTMEIFRAAGDVPKQLYIKYILHDVIITSIETSGSGGEEKPRETLLLAFSKIEWTFQPQLHTLSSVSGGAITTKWSLITNTGEG